MFKTFSHARFISPCAVPSAWFLGKSKRHETHVSQVEAGDSSHDISFTRVTFGIIIHQSYIALNAWQIVRSRCLSSKDLNIYATASCAL